VAWFQGIYAQALARARDRDQEVFLDVGAAWCPPCQELHEGAFRDPTVRAHLDGGFISISIDADVAEGPQLVDWYGVQAFPTLLRVDAMGNELARLEEEIRPASVAAWLKAPAPSHSEILHRARAREEEAPSSAARRRARVMAEVSYADAALLEELLEGEDGPNGYVRDVIAHWGRGTECGVTTKASLRRRASSGGVHGRDAITRLAALSADASPKEAIAWLALLAKTHGSQAAWACAQLELPPQACLPWIPAPTGESLGDAALAALEARLAGLAGDVARAERSMERARRLAPNVAAYRHRARAQAVTP
jgi:thiol-disulfide isomerase/thioredoxin